MIKQSLFIFFLILALSVKPQGSELAGHLFTGGSTQLSFGTLTYIDVAPVFGYYFNDYLSAGIGGTYQFMNDRYYSPPFRLNIFGGRAFLRVHPISMLFLHAEYEVLTYKTNFFSPTNDVERIISEGVLLGAGYRSDLSDRVHYFAMLLYDINNSIYSPHGAWVYRVGIEVAFPVGKNAE